MRKTIPLDLRKYIVHVVNKLLRTGFPSTSALDLLWLTTVLHVIIVVDKSERRRFDGFLYRLACNFVGNEKPTVNLALDKPVLLCSAANRVSRQPNISLAIKVLFITLLTKNTYCRIKSTTFRVIEYLLKKDVDQEGTNQGNDKKGNDLKKGHFLSNNGHSEEDYLSVLLLLLHCATD